MPLFLLSQAYFLIFLAPRDKRKASQRNLYCIHSRNPCFKKSSPELYERDIERARCCQHHRESVNMKTFDQSEHDAGIWYHGTAASKAVSRLRLPFPLPRIPLGSLRSPIFFLFDSVFCLFSPLRSLVPGYS